MGWSCTCVWWLSSGRKSVAAEAPPKEWGALAPYRRSTAQTSSTWKKGSHKIYKNQWGNLAIWIKRKEPKNPDIPLKGLMHRLTCSQTLTLDLGGRLADQEVQETYKEDWVVWFQSERCRTVAIAPLSAPLWGSLQTGVILLMLSPLPT